METNQPHPPAPSVRTVQPFAFLGEGPSNDAPTFTEYMQARQERETSAMRADTTDHPSSFQADVPDDD